MKNTRKKAKPVPADAIARQAERGKDISRFFTNSGRMMRPIQRTFSWFAGPQWDHRV
jgi:hypothetical protein